jgi:NAD(P)-dependent dehydrogenase (short-subunit alcohol dehydrogenase family)
MRNPAANDTLRAALHEADVHAEILALDVVDSGAVTRVTADVLARYGRIDVLVNNAGVSYNGTIEELSMDEIQGSLDVNYLGAVRMIKAALPAMREAKQGRILNISSIGGTFGQPFNDAYCAAKCALEGMSEALYPVALAFGVHVAVIEPGPVSSDILVKTAGVSLEPTPGPYAGLRANFRAVQKGAFDIAPTPAEIGAFILAVANTDEPKFRYQTSENVARLIGRKLADLDGSRITGMTRRWVMPSAE